MNIKNSERYNQEVLRTEIDRQQRTSLDLILKHDWIKFMVKHKPQNLNKLSLY